MKTIITVLLTVASVTFGVKLDATNESKEASSFFLLDNCYSIEECYEKK